MSRIGSLVFSLTIVLLGVVLRAAPHLDRVVRVWTVDQGASATVAGESETLQKSLSKTIMEGVSSQLSQRPIGLLVAGLTTEALLIASMLYVGVRFPLIAATFGALAVRYRVVTIGLLTLLVVGFINGSEQTFPFLPWRMYAGVPSGNPQAYEFVGISHRGQAVRLDLHQILPALGPRRLEIILAEQSASLQNETQASRRDSLWARHRATLQAVGRLYNYRHLEDPLLRIVVSTATLSPEEFYTPAAIRRRVLWSIEMN